jgi:hypothetical protein
MDSLELLDQEEAVMLPERQTLGLFDFAAISATNTAVALNVASLLTLASANAGQSITVVQS